MKVSSIIKNPVARKVTNSIKIPIRKVLAGAMMMTAVLGGSAVANAKTTNNDRVINQTEVVSAEGAKALASMTLQSPTVPKVHNNSIDKRIIGIAENNDEIASNTQILNDLYNSCGTYVTSIYAQHILDNTYFNEKLLKKTNLRPYYDLLCYSRTNFQPYRSQPELSYETYLERIEQASKHFEEVYNPWIEGILVSVINSNNLSFEEANKILDNIVVDNTWTNKDGYDRDVNRFMFVLERSNKDLNSVKVKSDILAYKMYLIDNMYYKYVSGLLGIHRLLYGNDSIDGGFYRESGTRNADSPITEVIGANIDPLVYIYEK